MTGTVNGDRDALFEYLTANDIPVYRVWEDPWAWARHPEGFEFRFPNSDALARDVVHFSVRNIDPDSVDVMVETVRSFYDDRE